MNRNKTSSDVKVPHMETHQALLERIANNNSICQNVMFVVGMPRSGSSMMGLAMSLPENVCYLEESLAIQPFTFMQCGWLSGLKLAARFGHLVGGEESLPRAKLRQLRNRLRKRDLLAEVITRGLLHAKVDKTYDLRPKNPLHEVTGVFLDSYEHTLAARLAHKYRRLLHAKPESFPHIFFEDCRLLSGRTRVLEKTPTNVLSIPMLRHLFPSARIVFIHRQDKRAVVASYLKMVHRSLGYERQIRNRVTEHAAKHMAKYHEKASEIFAKERSSKTPGTLCVTYEDLVQSPASMMAEIYQFAGLELTPEISKHWDEIGPTKCGFDSLIPELRQLVSSIA